MVCQMSVFYEDYYATEGVAGCQNVTKTPQVRAEWCSPATIS